MYADVIAHTVAHLPMVKYEIGSIANKYDLSNDYCAVSTIKELVWLSFIQKVQL